MVIINREESNTLDLTLSEKVTISNPYYLFVFTNKQTNEVSKCLLTDSSAYPERYNRFELVEPDDIVLIPGDYIYQVYEKSANNTVIPEAEFLLETGIGRVPVTLLSETEFSSTLAIAPLVYESTN